MASNLVSVVIPVYNAEEMLDETLDSVLNQSYKNWELVVVNDKSTDNSLSVINKYIQKDQRIRLINLEKNHGGPAEPRNIGIENAKGDIIALLDSDDVWHNEKLSICLANTDDDIIYHRERYFKNEIEDGVLSPECDVSNFNDLYNYMLLKGNVFSPSAILIRKEILLKNKFNISSRYHGVEDFDLWLRLAKNKNIKYRYVNEVLGYYRLHEGGISKNFKKHGQKERNLIRDHFSQFHFYSSPYMFYMKYIKLFRSLLANIIRTVQYKQKMDYKFYLNEFRKCF